MSRIELMDTGMTMAMKMSEGNPGALRVILECMRDGGRIDPDSVMGGLGPLLMMDTLKFYGSSIWMLYKYVCKESLGDMIGLLRGWQLGFVSESALRRAVNNRGEGIDLVSIMSLVKQRLPKFQGSVTMPVEGQATSKM